MQAIRFSGLRYLALFLTVGPAPLAGSALAQEFSVTPSERVTRFVNVRAEPSAESERLARLSRGERLPLVDSVPQRWPGESGQRDKWIFCLRAARIAADQEST